MVLARQPAPRQAVIGTYLVPATHGEVNVQELWGAVDVLTAFVREHELRVVGAGEQVGMDAQRQAGTRGRKPGSTNWTKERYYREYTAAAVGMERPYKRTYLAAQMGLGYAAFANYLGRWGPPPGVAAPGD
jgi:ferric-dicitrate binding protein FerR (iron transport regulator)